MEWWQILTITIAAIGLLIEVYLRLWPVLKSNAAGKKKAKLEIQAQLEILETYVESYDWGSIGPFEKACKDAPISKQLAKELDELIKLALEYHQWRHECFKIINTEVRVHSKQFSTLNNVFSLVFHMDLEGVFAGTEGSVSYNIYKAIYKGELTFDTAKESILKGNWDREVAIQADKSVMFKDIIDGGDFHKFVESLRGLQNRTPIRTLRNSQAEFLYKAQSLLKELT